MRQFDRVAVEAGRVMLPEATMNSIDEHQLQTETLVEPYRTKVVEKIRLLGREERLRVLKNAFFSIAYIDSADVFIDLATDSGTGAMSDEQWAALMRGDESYIRSKSFFRFESAIQDITAYAHVIPTHQGRAAENIMCELLIEPGEIVLSNTHFDTTRAHVENRKGIAIDLVGDSLWNFDADHPFKGNIDLGKLRLALERYGDRVAFIVITILNNLACSSPVSMDNIRQTKLLADEFKVAVFFDACRFAENAYFIKMREPGYANRSIQQIVHEMFSYGQGCWMSAKKDAIVNIGGFIALRDKSLARRCQERLVLYEGFPSYGGLARRDLEAIAVGMYEGIDEEHLRHRTGQVAYLGGLLEKVGIRCSKPFGGSGVFVDVESLYGHVPPEHFPGIAMTCDLYLEGGVRAGALPFHLKTLDASGEIVARDFQFARFAIPRRVYSKSHLEFVARTMSKVKESAHRTRGYRLTYAPEVLEHFFAKFEPLP